MPRLYEYSVYAMESDWLGFEHSCGRLPICKLSPALVMPDLPGPGPSRIAAHEGYMPYLIALLFGHHVAGPVSHASLSLLPRFVYMITAISAPAPAFPQSFLIVFFNLKASRLLLITQPPLTPA
jgi:hypothetical protein